MLKITNLVKKYKNNDKLAVDNITLHVKEGEVFGFLGPNGAGKSTTIKCACGILPFDSGSISICGCNIKDNAVKAKMNIGYVSDNHAVYDRLTAREYLDFICDIYGVGKNDRKLRAEKYLSAFSLNDAYDTAIKSFSHGMKQKICVIGALIHNPKLWILDEPLTGLDPKSAFVLKELMREHCNEGNSVFFSSHILEVVEKVCDRVAIIQNGSIATQFDTVDLKTMKDNKSLEDVFLSVTEKNGVNTDDIQFD